MYRCAMLGSSSEKWYRTIASQSVNGLDHADHQPEHGFKGWHQDDVVQSFGKKYLAMKARFRALGLILPVLLADATSLLCSNKDWERVFMVKLWELLEIYSNGRPIDRSDHNYPNRFFKEDGPIPILVASAMNLPFAAIIARPPGQDHGPFRWSDDEYRYALLAMRSLGIPPQYHVDGNKKSEHARCSDGGEFKSCRQLLPSVFEVPNITAPRNPWDKDQAGCGGCPAHAVVFSFIIVAQRTPPNQQMQGGLSPSTVPRRDIGQAVKNLTNQEFAYENFWRLLAQIQCQWPGWWDSANHWAMKKLGVFDEMDQERKYHYNHHKVQKIKDDTASFHKQRNARLAMEKWDAGQVTQARVQATNNHRQTVVDRKPKVEKKVKVESNLSDSDVEVLPTQVPGRKPLVKYTARINAVASGSGFNGNERRIKQENRIIDEKPRIKRERIDLEVRVPKKKVKVEIE